MMTAGRNGGRHQLKAVIEALDQMADEKVAEIEVFRSILKKTLDFVDQKLRPSTRTGNEDKKAVNNPTQWVDLGRNILRTLRDRLDQGKQNPSRGKTQRFLEEEDF